MQIASITKFFSAAALAVVATSSSSFQLAAADVCDSSQMDQLVTASELVYSSSDCATINSDFATATKDDVCDSSCMDYLSSIASEFPDCEYSGTNMYTTLQFLLSECGMSDESNAAAGALGSDATLVCLSGVAAAALALVGGH